MAPLAAQWPRRLGADARDGRRALDAGGAVDWAGFDRDRPRRRVALPTLAVRARALLDRSAPTGAPPARAADAAAGHPLLGPRLRSALQRHSVRGGDRRATRQSYLADHRVHGLAVLPATAYLEMCLAAAARARPPRAARSWTSCSRRPWSCRTRHSHDPGRASTPGRDGASVRVFSLGPGRSRGVAPAPPRGTAPAAAPPPPQLTEALARCVEEVPVDAFYAALKARGLDFGPPSTGSSGCAAGRRGRRADQAAGQARHARLRAHPALLDACLQVIAAALASPEKGGDPGTFMPISARSAVAPRTVRSGMWSHVRLRPREGPDTLVADVSVIDADGAVALELEGLRFARAAADALGRGAGGQVETWLYGVEWRPAPLPGRPRWPPGRVAGRCPSPRCWTASGPGSPTPSGAGYEEMLGRDRSTRRRVRRGGAAPARRQARHRRPRDCRAARPHCGSSRATVDCSAGCSTSSPRRASSARPRKAGPSSRDAERGGDAEAGATALLARYADAPELELVARCGPELAGVLRGTIDPLDLLFPGGSLELARRLYRESPAANACNALVGDAVSAVDRRGARPAAAHPRDRRRYRGHHGGAAALLPPDRTEYVFTDVSPVFVAEAAETFAAHPFVRSSARHRARTRDPGARRAAPSTSSSSPTSLHATSDLRRSLAHCRELLAPEGSWSWSRSRRRSAGSTSRLASPTAGGSSPTISGIRLRC